MYSNAAAVSRPELSVFVEEARAAEQFMIAQQLLPIFDSPSRTGRYPKLRIDAGELLKYEANLRGPSGTYSEIDQKWEWDTYDCEDRGLVERVDDVWRQEMQSFFDAEVTTSKLVARRNLLAYEVRAAAAVQNASTFTATNSAVAWTEANLATIDFPRDLLACISRLEMKAVQPNTLVLTRDHLNRLRRSTILQNYLYGNAPGGNYKLIRPEDIGAAFGIPNVLIARASADFAKKGAARDLRAVWSNSYAFVGFVASGDFMQGGIGRTITWGADTPAGLFATETWRDENRRGDMVRVRSHSIEKIIDPTAGELITTQWA